MQSVPQNIQKYCMKDDNLTLDVSAALKSETSASLGANL